MTIEDALKISSDRENYPDFFPIDLGSDFKLKTHPEYFIKIKNPRTINIEVDSFIGTCPGARHYYVKIIADGVTIYAPDKETGKVWNCSGYICDEFANLSKEKKASYSSFYTIEVCRIITAEDKELNPERWKDYEIDDRTNAFDTEEEAINQAKQIINARFSPEWKIIINKK